MEINIALGIINLVITFSATIIIEKIFKKEGLYVWISVATITANIMVCKRRRNWTNDFYISW